MERTNQPTVSNEDAQSLSRRELLKALGAVTGALATAAFLPGKWSKPIMEVGRLPGHARATVELELHSLKVGATAGDRAKSVIDNNYTHWADFNFYDPADMVDDSATLYAWTTDCGALDFSGATLNQIPGYYCGIDTGPPHSMGSVHISFNWPCDGPLTDGSQLCVRLGIGPRWSNKECATPNEEV